MSKLRKDRMARRWARYTKRNGQLARHDADARETWGTWKAIGWFINRNVADADEETRLMTQTGMVLKLFYNH